jgi:4-diphosphocytidyl-2C-methyl-D-erythritol kinase
VTVRVPAKVNLQLSVGPPRGDGYHDLVTVFHAVSLFDEVTVRPADRTSVVVTGEDATSVPAGRAHGHLVEQRHGVEHGYQVVIAVATRRPHGELQIHLRGNPDGHRGHG